MSMLAVLETFKPLVKVRNLVEKAIIDDKIFRLHYRTTALILFVCCAFVTTYTIFGDPISCMGDFKEDDKIKVVNTFCYLGYTYTIPTNENSDGKIAGLGDGKDKKYYSYYRWVPQLLFLQGIMFYLPHWIWKIFEDKKITHLTNDLRGPMTEITKEHENRLRSLAKYAADSLHTHNTFALKYYLCEILNFINVILNMYMIDVFLDGEFMNYGLDVLSFTDTPQENRTDPMIKIFPRVTKCDFHKYGASGTLQHIDFLCVLALNNLNEKIYIFLWFWLIFLSCVSIFPMAYNFAVYISSTFRKRELRKYCVLNRNSHIEELAEKAEIGDFFLWDLMGRNMNSKCYNEFIDRLYESLVK